MSTIYYYQPVYKIEFWNSAKDTLKYSFGTGSDLYPSVTSFSIKPGMTSAVGSFEIEIHDTGSDVDKLISGSAFSDIDVFDFVKIWYGYTGSGINLPTPEMFTGYIDSKEVNYSLNGCTRKFMGRDQGQAYFNIIERRAFTGSCRETVKQLHLDTQLYSSNTYIELTNDTNYFMVANGTVFDALKEVCDFNNKDFYIDSGSSAFLHYFDRQSKTDTLQPFIEGVNIFNYRYIKDLTEVKNDIYVFGNRLNDNTTGSDIPTQHDTWTQADTTGWTAAYSGSNNIWVDEVAESLSIGVTGSGNLCMGVTFAIQNLTNAGVRLTKTISEAPIMMQNGDFIHGYICQNGAFAATTSINFINIRLETTSSDYFSTYLETMNGGGRISNREFSLSGEPDYEGISIIGDPNTNTGSYKWIREGNPDWFNINSISFYFNCGADVIGNDITVAVDGLYFGITFQYHSVDSTSITNYGLRSEVINNTKIGNQEYCKNFANTYLTLHKNPPVQIEMETITRPYIIGTQYPITLKSESVSDSLFELIDLSHNWSGGKLTSKCLFTNQAQIRIPIPILNYPVQQAMYQRSILDDINDLIYHPRLIFR